MDVVELFSGIGSQAKALEKIDRKYKVLNTCEWDIHAFLAYDIIHNGFSILPEVNNMTKEDLVHALQGYNLSMDGKKPMALITLSTLNVELLRAILSALRKTNNLVDITQVSGMMLPKNIDLMTYSFPCQDLSNVGAFHGYNKGIDRDAKNRSGLLWEVERILFERRDGKLPFPKFLLLENVTTLLSKRHKNNFDEWKSVLEKLGYHNRVFKLSANDFGIPQSRVRLLMLSVFVGTDHSRGQIEQKLSKYLDEHDLNSQDYIKHLNIEKPMLSDFLYTNYEDKGIFQEALLSQPNDTPSRKKIWDENLKIIDSNYHLCVDYVPTITTVQDRHPNSGNIYFNIENGKSQYRFLTPRECFRLMGYSNIDFQRISDCGLLYRQPNTRFFSRDTLYRLAGNSIVINVLEQIFILTYDIKRKNLYGKQD